MKYIALVVLLISATLHAEGPSECAIFRISDVNNECIIGAKVECLGTGKVYYTNLKGEVRIPQSILGNSKGIRIESISYKTIELNQSQINSKIILAFR